MEIDSETELLSDSDGFDVNLFGEDSDDSSSYESDDDAQNDSKNDTAVSMYQEWNETQAGESVPPPPPRFPFIEINSGTTSISDTADKTPLYFMNMFFTDQLVEYIVQETNRYAKQKRATWQEPNPDEFRVFLALLQLQGIL